MGLSIIMLKLAGRSLSRRVPRLSRSSWGLVAAGAVVVTSVSLASSQKDIYNDAKIIQQNQNEAVLLSSSQPRKTPSPEQVVQELKAHAWGSNGKNTLDGSVTDVFKLPTETLRLSGVALRDVALHETHAAAVDAAGDVYQWGDIGDVPTCTLKGQVRSPFILLDPSQRMPNFIAL